MGSQMTTFGATATTTAAEAVAEDTGRAERIVYLRNEDASINLLYSTAASGETFVSLGAGEGIHIETLGPIFVKSASSTVAYTGWRT